MFLSHRDCFSYGEQSRMLWKDPLQMMIESHDTLFRIVNQISIIVGESHYS